MIRPTEDEKRRGRAYRRNRHAALARMIRDRFPVEDFPRVADVGGGGGLLAAHLRNLGYAVTVIDPYARRSRAVKAAPGTVPVAVERRKFRPGDAGRHDLLVGVRPHGASVSLVRAATRVPVLMVPCWYCSVWGRQYEKPYTLRLRDGSGKVTRHRRWSIWPRLGATVAARFARDLGLRVGRIRIPVGWGQKRWEEYLHVLVLRAR